MTSGETSRTRQEKSTDTFLNESGPPVVAVMSGKGGVGKTALSVNMARLYSEIGNVVLVDLDLQNRGATSVFGFERLTGPTTEQLLISEAEKPSPVRIGKRAFLVPASLRELQVDSEARRNMDVEDLKRRLLIMIARIIEECHPVLVILDCHGGIAAESVAAFAVASHVIVVTEPDAVTFGGTLTLIAAINQDLKKEERRPVVRIVVNRIPAKYNWRDLEQVYATVVRDFQSVSAAVPDVSYIPVENELFLTFGEYPFQVDLAPKSLFAKKLRLLLSELLSNAPPEFPKNLGKPRKVDRIRKALLTAESKVARTIFSSFVALAFLVLVALPVLEIEMNKGEDGAISFDVLVLAQVVLGVPLLLFFWVGTVQLARYYTRTTIFHLRCVLLLARRKASHAVLAIRSSVFAFLAVMAVCAPVWWVIVYSASDFDFAPAVDFSVVDASGERVLVLTSWQKEAMNGALSASARLEQDGYDLVEPLILTEFSDGQEEVVVPATLEAAVEYWLVAGCDSDCINLSIRIRLFDQEAVATEGDSPELNFTTRNRGDYQTYLKVDECRAEPCAVMVARYRSQSE